MLVTLLRHCVSGTRGIPALVYKVVVCILQSGFFLFLFLVCWWGCFRSGETRTTDGQISRDLTFDDAPWMLWYVVKGGVEIRYVRVD